MTDEEPEPFRMPADPDEEAPAGEDEPTPAGQDELAVPVESIADLINEATRTAAEQAEAEARGDAPQDRSSDVWGEPAEAPVHDRDAVWQQAENDAASNVWDLDEDGDAMWGAVGAAGAATADPAPTAEPPASAEPTAPREAATGRPAAAAGMPADDDLEPETFTFAVDEGGGTPPPATPAPGAGGEADDDEPETFSFPAGPGTTAPAALPDQPEDEEPEAFTYAVADEDPARPDAAPDQPDGATAEADEVEEWTVPGADAADEDIAVDNDVWTFSVTTDQNTPLADTASPRDDAGWHDLEAEQDAGWEVADLGPRGSTDVEDSDAFIAAVQAHEDDADDDAPWTAPALADEDFQDGEQDDGEEQEQREDLPPADVVTAEVRDALGDLLGNGEQDAVIEAGGPPTPAATPAAAAPAPDDTAPDDTAPDDTAPDDTAGDARLDDFDHLDDLDDLDHLDDMAAAAVPEVGHGEPGDDDASTEEDTADAAEIDQPLDAPTAARQVMEPGSVTFSSSGKKKRGLFG